MKEIERNKYNNISGGFIFDYIDKKAHESAIEHIGECQTAHVNINFLRPIKTLENTELWFDMVDDFPNKCLMTVNLLDEKKDTLVFATFLFVKNK